MRQWRTLLGVISSLMLAVHVGHADEVDDILKLKQRNHDKVKKFSGEFTVEVDQPKNDKLKNPKTVKMRYRMTAEKIPPQARKGSPNPWRVETEVLEPLKMKMRIEGDHVWFFDQHGEWVELPMTPEIQQQFGDMSERFLGSDPATLRGKFHIKLLRKNNPIFGPATKTVEFVPKGASSVFARMEEDVDSHGLVLHTRLYDTTNQETVSVKIRKAHRVKDVPVIEEMESRGLSPAGEILTITRCASVLVETE